VSQPEDGVRELRRPLERDHEDGEAEAHDHEHAGAGARHAAALGRGVEWMDEHGDAEDAEQA